MNFVTWVGDDPATAQLPDVYLDEDGGSDLLPYQNFKNCTINRVTFNGALVSEKVFIQDFVPYVADQILWSFDVVPTAGQYFMDL